MEQNRHFPDDIDDLLCEIPRAFTDDPNRSSIMHCGGGGNFIDNMYNGGFQNRDDLSPSIIDSSVSPFASLRKQDHSQGSSESSIFGVDFRNTFNRGGGGGNFPRNHDSFSNNSDIITNNVINHNNNLINNNNKMYNEFSQHCTISPQNYMCTSPWADSPDGAEIFHHHQQKEQQQRAQAQIALQQRLVQQQLDRQRQNKAANHLAEAAYGYQMPYPSTNTGTNTQQGNLFSPYNARTAAAAAAAATSLLNAQKVATLRLAAAAAAEVRSGVCRYYAQGLCSRADTCPFRHILPKSTSANPAGSYTRDALAAVLVSPEDKFYFPENRRPKKGNIVALRSCPKKIPPVVPPSEPLLSADLEAAGSDKYTSLDEVAGQILMLAKDQNGCRFLQRKFDEGKADDIQRIFVEIIDHIMDLMTDPFGNYLVQKLLDVSSDAQRKEILRVVTRNGQLVSISLNVHGTRAVQKLIETLKFPEQVSLVTNALRPGIVSLIQDLNGNHVVQKCLNRLSSEDNQFIIDAAARHCVEIATHRHGCCVLQRCVDFSSGAQRQVLVSEIASNALILSQDQYGNYVVQYILELGLPWATQVMIELEGNYALLAMQKFSSNVVEKCLKQAQDDVRARIIREIIISPLLAQLLQDPFANYVIQCALNVTKGSLHTALVEAIRPHSAILRSSPYGKRILSRINSKK